MKTLYLLSAAAAVAAIAGPASAQQPYPYSPYQPVYPQPAYPGYPQQAYPGYPQQGYAQPYGTNPVQQIIDQLLGNRYNVNDRTAVSRCASAALAQAQAQYRPGYGQPYGQPYNPQYGNTYGGQMRVTAITNVERRQSGLRVRGQISSGAYATPYGNQSYGYQGQRYADPRYAQNGDLSFRCNVDYRGYVTNVRVSRNDYYRR